MFSRKKKNPPVVQNPQNPFPLYYSVGMPLEKLIEYEKPEFFRSDISIHLKPATVKIQEEDKLFFADYAKYLCGLQKELQHKKYILMENLFQLLITPAGIVETLNADATMKNQFPEGITFSACFFRYLLVGMSVSSSYLKTLCDTFQLKIIGTPQEFLQITFNTLMIHSFNMSQESAQQLSMRLNYLFQLSFVIQEKLNQHKLEKNQNIKPIALKWTYIERFCYEQDIVSHDPVFLKFTQNFKTDNGILAEKYVCVTDLLEALENQLFKNSRTDQFFSENNQVLQKFHTELVNHFKPNHPGYSKNIQRSL